MALIRRFEDILAWQEGRKLSGQVYKLTAAVRFASDLGFRNQMRRAAVSSVTNIAEGFDCDSKREFARFLGIARRSVVEIQSLLYLAVDLRYITEVEFRAHYEQASKTKGLIGALKHSLGRK